MRRAIFPGSFDPLTLGHCEIIKKATKVFDQVIVSVGNNSEKKYMFSLEQRLNFISSEFKNNSLVLVEKYNGLTAEFCKTKNIKHIVRGLRNPADFEFEKAIAHTNRKLSGIETVFLLTSAKTSFISSSIVREIIINKGDYTSLVPISVRL